MARASKRVKKAMKSPAEKAAHMARKIGVPEAQIERGYVTHEVVERGQNIGQTVRILYPRLVDRWFAEGGIGFDDAQREAVNWVTGLWEKAGPCGPVTSAWGEQRGHGAGDGQRQQDALTQLSQLKAMFPHTYWSIFENVVRHNMPAGRAGSDLANNPAQAIAAARTTVGFIASKIAEWRGF